MFKWDLLSVWGIGPGQDSTLQTIDIAFLEMCFWVIPLSYWKICSTSHHSILQNLTVLLCNSSSSCWVSASLFLNPCTHVHMNLPQGQVKPICVCVIFQISQHFYSLGWVWGLSQSVSPNPHRVKRPLTLVQATTIINPSQVQVQVP